MKNGDAVLNWNDVLSPGEQQRIALARVYFHCPKFLIMDEATSALDMENEDKCFAELKKRGITMISVGHRVSLRQHHEVEIKLITYKRMNMNQVEVHKIDRSMYVNKTKLVEVSRGEMTESSGENMVEKQGEEEINAAKPMKQKETSMDGVFFRRLRMLHGIMKSRNFFSWTTLQYILLVVIVMIEMISTFLLSALVTKLPDDIRHGNVTSFYITTFSFCGLSVLGTIWRSLRYLLYNYIAIGYRGRLTDYIHEKYFENNSFYYLLSMDNEADNP